MSRVCAVCLPSQEVDWRNDDLYEAAGATDATACSRLPADVPRRRTCGWGTKIFAGPCLVAVRPSQNRLTITKPRQTFSPFPNDQMDPCLVGLIQFGSINRQMAKPVAAQDSLEEFCVCFLDMVPWSLEALRNLGPHFTTGISRQISLVHRC